jgi:hypothetical protein
LVETITGVIKDKAINRRGPQRSSTVTEARILGVIVFVFTEGTCPLWPVFKSDPVRGDRVTARQMRFVMCSGHPRFVMASVKHNLFAAEIPRWMQATTNQRSRFGRRG